jgi:hypothetical protein
MKRNVMNMKNLAWKLLLLERKTKNMMKITMNKKWKWLLLIMVHLTMHILSLDNTLDYPPF